MNFQALNSDLHAILQLMMNQLNSFDQIVRQLQVQINELSFQISTSTQIRSATSTDFKEATSITITTAKFKKLSDFSMFNED